MTNNEKFNVLLNSCAHSREIYNVLLSLATLTSKQECVNRETIHARLSELCSELETALKYQRECSQ